MKKVALVFVLAVFAPSLVLAWLAIRSVRDQQIVLERQQTLLYQSVADSLAKEVNEHLDRLRADFKQEVDQIVAKGNPRDAAATFDNQVRLRCPSAEVGFVVSLDREVLAPSLFAGPVARQFRLQNDRFLSSRESVEVYWNSPKGAINLSKLDQPKDSKDIDVSSKTKAPRAVIPEKEAPPDAPTSKVTAEETGFQQIVGNDTEGTIARFLQNKLTVMFWHRPSRDPQLVFGAQLNLARVVEALTNVVQVEPHLRGEICAALLDDAGHPVAVSRPGFLTEWKRPFVATEIGESLPHWEMAVYLLNPAQLNQSARTLRLTFGLLIGMLVLAIGLGSALIVADLQRQLALARQKTDFVSNVSHELKTPLTSIRLFSELLAEGRVAEPEKQRQFLQIITAETARLTRLINNVLDFARMERGEKKYQFASCDLNSLVRETVESVQPLLEKSGFKLTVATPVNPVEVQCDRDALAQVLVNLLSNAEKYSGTSKEIEVQLRAGTTVEVRVLDRGPGVPRGCEEKIFEQFYRANDSLASGIQGSGLGLTLARQIARAHGGEVVYEPRDGGGSCFTLRLPLNTL